MQPEKKERARIREDRLKEVSDIPGWKGHLETFIRGFRNLGYILLFFPIVGICFLCIGLSFVTPIYFIKWVLSQTSDWGQFAQNFTLGLSLAMGYFLYGLTLIFVVPTVNFLLRLKLKSWRGIWFSINSIPWFLHNALTYTVRFTFLDFITPTPLNILFFRMMGMKIGKGCMINTPYISDPSLITLEDHVTIGGSVTMFAHYGQKGYLIVEPVLIKRGATIGLKASVMGDVIVGENALVAAHAVLLPKTRIPDEMD